MSNSTLKGCYFTSQLSRGVRLWITRRNLNTFCRLSWRLEKNRGAFQSPFKQGFHTEVAVISYDFYCSYDVLVRKSIQFQWIRKPLSFIPSHVIMWTVKIQTNARQFMVRQVDRIGTWCITKSSGEDIKRTLWATSWMIKKKCNMINREGVYRYIAKNIFCQ